MNSPDPHQRKGAPAFRNKNAAPQYAGSSTEKTVPFGIKTIPLGASVNPNAVAEDGPTLPLGGPGHTLPITPQSQGGAMRGGAPRKDDLGPVVGWLVIISGPGRGHSLELGYGYNSIGRSASNQVVLNFGDTSISDVGHATIAYDNVGYKFYVTHGQSRNMVFMDNAAVLTPMEIKMGSQIRIGKTLLMFVPFCSSDLNWEIIPEDIK